MAASASFLSAALASARASAEYATFAAARAAFAAAPEGSRQARWSDCYSDAQPGLSPAYRLRRALRDVVANTQISQSVTLSPAESEAAYQFLVAQLVPEVSAPSPPTVLTPALTADDLGVFRAAMARLASD